MSREDVERELLARLATFEWHDVTGECQTGDPDVVRIYGCGLNTPLRPIYLLARHSDGLFTLGATGEHHPNVWRTPCTDQDLLGELWAAVDGRVS